MSNPTLANTLSTLDTTSRQSTPVEIRSKTMPLVKDELAAVGIEVNIDQMPGHAFFDRYGPLVQGAFDLAEYADIGREDSGVDAVTKFGRTLVPGARQSSMKALQVLLEDDLPTLPLYFRPNVTAASNRLVNWKPEYNSNGYTWNAWEWDLK